MLLLLNNSVDAYKVEMVLMLYTIVIGFSFKIFQDFRICSFQSIAGISTILFLSARLLSVQSKFANVEQFGYTEIYFFVDIAIMLSFYRFLSILKTTYNTEDAYEAEIQYAWLWLALMMALTLIYRSLYIGVKITNIFQPIIIIYIFSGYFLCRYMKSQCVAIKKQEIRLLIFTLPLFVMAIIYCVIRFRYPHF